MGKVYRVTVRYPQLGARERVKLGGKQTVVQTWAAYLRAHEMAQRGLARAREVGFEYGVTFHTKALEDAVFKVEVAPNAAFQDISGIYNVEAALEAKERLRTINHAGR